MKFILFVRGILFLLYLEGYAFRIWQSDDRRGAAPVMGSNEPLSVKRLALAPANPWKSCTTLPFDLGYRQKLQAQVVQLAQDANQSSLVDDGS